MSHISLSEFSDQLKLEVQTAMEAGNNSGELEDYLSSVVLDFLEEMGEVLDPIMAPFRARGLQMSGYAMDDENESVDIFVSLYFSDDGIATAPLNLVDAAIKRALQIFRKASQQLFSDYQRDEEAYEFAKRIHDNINRIKRVRILFITNGRVKNLEMRSTVVDNVEFCFAVWDIERLYRCSISGKQHEPISIDFVEAYGKSIECIENRSEAYTVYLALLSGEILADIYMIHGARLLERNVRSFLHLKGKVNSAIHKTLKDNPDMFLAYNNGISVTAEKVETTYDSNGRPLISKIHDMQIVNGGQTTASIFNVSKDPKWSADLSKVFVQMKVTEIKNADEMDILVPNISLYANSQNKVDLADFSANDPYHRTLEQISRTTWTPNTDGLMPKNWFYERARGQYADRLSYESSYQRQKKFKEEHPLFTKTDVAKYENTWDSLPYFVSEGAQKNFKRFTMRVTERNNFKPDQKYYEGLIAKTIIFRQADKIISNLKYGGYKANLVTYTLSLIYNRTAQRIDLARVWKDQNISQALVDEISIASKAVFEAITNPPDNGNITEWCKNKKCWEKLLESNYRPSNELKNELIDLTYDGTQSGPAGIDKLTDDEIKIIEKVHGYSAQNWFALSKWAKETGNFQPWQRSIIFNVGTYISHGKQVTIKMARHASKAMENAIEKGFNPY
ncbi:MAG: abortive phage infection protein [Sphingobacteriia bacterium]|nr:abortive phage infection protein [Sphingobacteriia bacterium]